MILTCPACGTRYQADEAKFPPGGRQVRCARCGHVWHQAVPATIDDAPPLVSESMAAAGTGAAPQGLRDFKGAAAEEPRRPLLPALGVALGWIVLVAAIAGLGWLAVRYRGQVVLIWPQSAAVYAALGLDVNAHGIDLAGVDYRRRNENGEIVLAVTGRIVNHGDRELPVPQTVIVTLSDAKDHELYHWSFTPGIQTLKPGRSAAFLTRLTSPPAGARHLDVRFAPGGP